MRGWLVAGLIGVWGLALAAPAATASPTLAGDVIDQYDQGDGPTKLEIEDTLIGVQEGFRVANKELQSRGQPFLYCQPHNLILTGGQLVAMIRRAIEAEPDVAARDFAVALLAVDRTTFPCARRGE